MIKDFETYINEDYFSKLANRKDTGNVRKENDIPSNILDIQPTKFKPIIDKKLSVYWADRRLVRLDDTCDERIMRRWQIDEINQMNLHGWRLPTKDEMQEFIDNVAFKCELEHRNMGNPLYDIKVDGMKNLLEDACYRLDNRCGYLVDYHHAHAVGFDTDGEMCWMHMYLDRKPRMRKEKEFGYVWKIDKYMNIKNINDTYFNIMLVKDK